MRWFTSLAVALALGVAAAACNNGSSTTSVIAPTATPTPETFTGSVDVGGVDFKPFAVAQTGELDVMLTAAGPPSTIFMGVGIGIPSGTTCALISGAMTIAQAGTSILLTGTASAGSFCVQVYDVGNQTAPVTYTVTVVHT